MPRSASRDYARSCDSAGPKNRCHGPTQTGGQRKKEKRDCSKERVPLKQMFRRYLTPIRTHTKKDKR